MKTAQKGFLCALFGFISFIVNAQQYLIKAHLTGYPNGTNFYIYNCLASKNIDTVIIKNDRFTSTGHFPNPPGDLLIYTNLDPKTSEPMGCSIRLLFGNDDTIKIEGDAKGMPYDISIKGSRIQDIENELSKLLYANNKKMQALHGPVWDEKEQTERMELEKRNNEKRKEFALRHCNTYAGLRALSYNMIGADTLRRIYDSLPHELKNWAYGQTLGFYLWSNRFLKVHDFITDFDITARDGTTKRIFDNKGGYLLLYFYTSINCMLCENQMYDLLNIDKRYGKKITIIPISVDSNKITWQKTIDSKMPWPAYWANIKDMAYNSKYGPYLSPAYYLVDPQGKILYKHRGFSSLGNSGGPLEMQIRNLIGDK